MDVNDKQANTILLVDDNPDIQTVISLSLEHFGYEVICANNGEQAISLTASRKPQIAIIDYGLPDMDGIEVGKRILQLTENDGQVLLILFSGSHDPDIKERADAAGFQTYIVKPIRINSLIEQIQLLESEKTN